METTDRSKAEHEAKRNNSLHLGRKISRLRELRGIKQEAMAFELGVSQQTVSRMEASETVDNDMLEKVAKALGLPLEAIHNFDEEQVINIISSTFNDNAVGVIMNNYNPIEKIIRLHDEKIALYERMLKEKDEMMERLERLTGK